MNKKIANHPITNKKDNIIQGEKYKEYLFLSKGSVPITPGPEYIFGLFLCHQFRSLLCACAANISANPFSNDVTIPSEEKIITRNLVFCLFQAKPSAANNNPLNAAIQSIL